MKYRMRFDKYDVQKFQFLAYVVGQSETVFGKPVSVADIAPTIGASKPTAQKFLERMVEIGYLVKREIKYRSNAKKYEYRLSEQAYNNFQDGVYDGAYEWLKSIMFQIRFERGSGKVTI